MLGQRGDGAGGIARDIWGDVGRDGGGDITRDVGGAVAGGNASIGTPTMASPRLLTRRGQGLRCASRRALAGLMRSTLAISP